MNRLTVPSYASIVPSLAEATRRADILIERKFFHLYMDGTPVTPMLVSLLELEHHYATAKSSFNLCRELLDRHLETDFTYDEIPAWQTRYAELSNRKWSAYRISLALEDELLKRSNKR